MDNHYDAIIIGAGMSGLAAGIRLAMFDKRVCILEKHSIPGGLNSYYRRHNRNIDVGLHAVTNFASKNEKGRPLTKLLKQLRISYDDLQLTEQLHSQISFPQHSLNFTNNIEKLLDEINKIFPTQLDGFKKLIKDIEQFDDLSLTENEFVPARKIVEKYITDRELTEMIMYPLLIYGSAWEHDMNFAQFVTMFKSIFLEGLARPRGGIKTIINLLLNRFQEYNGEMRLNSEVEHIETTNGKVTGVTLTNKEQLFTDNVFSSAGHPETLSLAGTQTDLPAVGAMSFCECILFTDKKPSAFDLNSSIIFLNKAAVYHYRKPNQLFDTNSTVLCFPNNFKDDDYQEGIIRATVMANYDLWAQLDKKAYQEAKEQIYQHTIETLKEYCPSFDAQITLQDVFTPLTVARYTGKLQGTVYGSPDKTKDGKTPYQGLYICGTDQSFLGIVGSLLSGISMANLHGLMNQ